MARPAFLTAERLARFAVSLLLCLGLLLPLLLTFGAGDAAPMAVAVAVGLTALFTVLGAMRRGRLWLAALAGAAALLQLLLPSFGLFGQAAEAFKAVALYFSDVPSAAPLFSRQIALTLAVGLSAVSYAFSSRSVGFLPATIVTVLMLFGMWSLGRAQYLWYALPALVALLLLISQTSHEKIDLFEVLPMAALVVVLSMLLLPAGKTVLPPLNRAAMNLRQSIIDRFFFTDERSVFSLGNYGYYPQGNSRLGGPADPTDTPVMMVKTDGRALLRAVSKDEYTGNAWRDTSSAGRCRYTAMRWKSLREQVFGENMPPQAVRAASRVLDEHAVSVQMQDTAASTLFTPVFLRKLDTQNGMVPYFNEAGELFTTRDLIRDDRYTVFAPLLEGGDSALGSLMAALPKTADPNYAAIAQTYLKLPSHLVDTSDAERMRQDVANMTASAATPYEKACAIMRHLQRYYRYTLEPAAPPDTQDFVTHFLYVGREGYCTYYASAMTVLCRMAGLPARYVEGFLAKPSGDGLAYVTGKDAHAWTEVYFEGFGWVPFDATPTQRDKPPEEPPPEEPEPTPTPEPPQNEPDQPEPTPEPPENEPPENEPEPPPTDDEDKPPFPWWLILVLAALGALIVRIILRTPDRMAAKQETREARVFIYGSAAFTLMKLGKYAPGPGETPLLFARRMDRRKVFPVAVAPLWRMMAASHYGRAEVSADAVAQAREIYHRLYKPQRPLRKLHFLLLCAFLNAPYTALDTKLTHAEPESRYSYQAQAQKAAAQGKKGKAAKRAKTKRKGAPAGKRPQAKQPPKPAAPKRPPESNAHGSASAPKAPNGPERRRRADRNS